MRRMGNSDIIQIIKIKKLHGEGRKKMIGAIIGDIVGSRFGFDDNNIKSKEFAFFHAEC